MCCDLLQERLIEDFDHRRKKMEMQLQLEKVFLQPCGGMLGLIWLSLYRFLADIVTTILATGRIGRSDRCIDHFKNV